MKFKEKIQEIEKIGEIENNNISIDTNNIDFIVTILSTNLYSNPIESFIRETVSNAWDSHVEAGVSDPVILELGKHTEGNYYCKIQDFGVGLSEERFNSIYKNIGSSTKRDTNNLLGGFGIGRFSALAYTDVVYITSIYNNEEFKYMMYKDGNNISIDLLHKNETDERNGVTVLVKVEKDDIYKFSEAIKKQLVYFENLYVIDSSGYTDIEHLFNSFKIKKYKNFSVNTLIGAVRSSINIVLGKVTYPLRFENLVEDKYPKYVKNYPIDLNFNIGELEVTPNREEILYSKRNITTIKNKLDKAIKEIDKLISNKPNKDYTNLFDYVKAIKDGNSLVLIEDNSTKITINSPSMVNNKISFRGEYYDKDVFIDTFSILFKARLIKVNAEINDYRIERSSIPNETIEEILKRDTHLCNVNKLKQITKIYIRDTFNNGTYFLNVKDVFNKTVYYAYTEYLKSRIDTIRYNNLSTSKHHRYGVNIQIRDIIIRCFIRYILDLDTFSDESVPQKWIEEKKQEEKDKSEKKEKINWKQTIKLHTLRTARRGHNKLAFESANYKFSQLSDPNFHIYGQSKCITVYGDQNDDKLKELYIVNPNNVNIVGVAPTKMKLLKRIKNFVEVNDFVTNVNYKTIRNIGTASYIVKKLPFLQRLSMINNIEEISDNLKSIISTLWEFTRMHCKDCFKNLSREDGGLRDNIYQLCLKNNYFNEEIKGIVDANYKLLWNSQCLIHFSEIPKWGSGEIPDNKINIAVDYVLSRKLFRPDAKAVFRLRNETIFNIKENENS